MYVSVVHDDGILPVCFQWNFLTGDTGPSFHTHHLFAPTLSCQKQTLVTRKIEVQRKIYVTSVLVS